MDRRLRAVVLDEASLTELLTEGNTITVTKGLPKGAAFLYYFIDADGRTHIIFHHPSFSDVTPGDAIPKIEIDGEVSDANTKA